MHQSEERTLSWVLVNFLSSSISPHHKQQASLCYVSPCFIRISRSLGNFRLAEKLGGWTMAKGTLKVVGTTEKWESGNWEEEAWGRNSWANFELMIWKT